MESRGGGAKRVGVGSRHDGSHRGINLGDGGVLGMVKVEGWWGLQGDGVGCIES